jgi:hypothetical protein
MRPGLNFAAAGFEANGRFIMNADRNHVLLPPVRFGKWFASGLMWLRKNVSGQTPPRVVFDEIDLPVPDAASLRFFRYNRFCRCVKEVTDEIPSLYGEWKRRLREMPLSVTLKHKGGMLSWVLGPYRGGKYSIIGYGDSGAKSEIPSAGIRRVDLKGPMLFRIRYDSPDGWITYSPLFQFDGQQLIKKQGN